MNTSLSLDSLASAINAAHERCRLAYRTVLDDAKSAGELLLQAKAQIPYGQWGNWIEQNCTFSDRTCQMYMQIAKHWQDINERSATVADLGVRAAIESIADKSAPEVINKKVTPSTAPAKPLVASRKPDIQPGDRITVTDLTSPEYGQELEVAEVVQDAIALVKKGGETYPLLVNQVEVVERPFPSSRADVKPVPDGIQGGIKGSSQLLTPDLEAQSDTQTLPPCNDGRELLRQHGGNRNPETTKASTHVPLEGTSRGMAGNAFPQKERDGALVTTPPRPVPKSNREVTVAALQDLLQRILEECGEYLPQELIDEAKELL